MLSSVLLCKICGESLRDPGGCANRLCPLCHRRYCDKKTHALDLDGARVEHTARILGALREIHRHSPVEGEK